MQIKAFGAGLLLLGGSLLLYFLALVLLVPLLLLSVVASVGSIVMSSGVTERESGENVVTRAAKEIASYLRNCQGMETPNALWNGCSGPFPRYAAYDVRFLETPYMRWGQQRCPGCVEWQSGSFQCVSFVLAAYSQLHPLDFSGNGDMFNSLYSTSVARQRGYVHIPTGMRGLPLSPGDMMAWRGGGAGHVSIVLAWEAPKGREPGKIVFAGANARAPIDTLSLDPETYRPVTKGGYWDGYEVQSYIHPVWLSSSSHVDLIKRSMSLPANNPYVAITRDAAKRVGVDETIFLRQIQQESNFNPQALSPVGAMGIAQFMPGTARGLGIDPWDPIQSLYGAARLLAQDRQYYNGDYLKALAAYNAGRGRVDQALVECGVSWRACLPDETRDYLLKILGL
jgi:hypothetical protein